MQSMEKKLEAIGFTRVYCLTTRSTLSWQPTKAKIEQRLQEMLADKKTDEELNRFLRGHRVVSVQKELVQNNGVAYWCFCIEYLHGAIPGGDKGKGRSCVDYKAVLSLRKCAVANWRKAKHVRSFRPVGTR